MADVPLPLGFDGTAKLPKTKRNLINCWNAGDKIISRPGIDSLNTTDGIARGQFVWNESLYQVSSTQLIKITDESTGAYSVIGTIESFEPIDWAIGFNHAVIIVRGATGKGYTLDSSDTLTETTNAFFVPSNSVSHINGRFVYVPFNGDPAFFSDVGDGSSIQANNFFDAEELPDKNTVVFNDSNTLYIGGTDSYQMFKNTGTDSLSFSQIPTGLIKVGYISGILEYNNVFVFVGRYKDQSPGIYAITQGQASKISNELIDTTLATYSLDELKSVVSSRFVWNGYDIATFTFPDDAFGLIGGNFFELTTQIDNNSTPWMGGYLTEFESKYYSAYKENIGVMSDIVTDYDNRFEQALIMAFESENNSEFSVSNFKLSVSQGFNDAIGSIGLEISHDGVLWSEKFYRKTGAIGQYSAGLEWNYSGAVYCHGFLGVKISTTEKVNFSISKFTIDI